jgi:hypothetical protein
MLVKMRVSVPPERRLSGSKVSDTRPVPEIVGYRVVTSVLTRIPVLCATITLQSQHLGPIF